MILIDTGPVIALLDVHDPEHHRVRTALATLREPIVFPTPILGEVGYFASERTTPAVEGAFLRGLASGAFLVVTPVAEDYARAADLVEQYGGFPLGTVDALIAAMAERLDVRTLFTLDRRHFGALRPAHCDAFTLVP